jgi:hypothetical protein
MLTILNGVFKFKTKFSFIAARLNNMRRAFVADFIAGVGAVSLWSGFAE